MEADLLPCPRELDVEKGACAVGPEFEIDLQVDDSRLGRALFDWRSAAVGRGPTEPRRARGRPFSDTSPDARGSVRPACSQRVEARPRIRVVVDRGAVRHRDGYRLAVRPGGIDIEGGSAAGCFHAIQTLRQLSRHQPAAGKVPCCMVIDWPDYSTRGLLHDVTRGKVPTIATLKLLVDRLAELKINQLQLYIEHAFVFSFDLDICGPDEGLTPDEIRELDGYCHERFIDLVPAIATLGHMGRILSMPRYSHLAEVAATKPWSAMTWPERMRGLTLDCVDPDAHRLIGHMWSDVLDVFSSPVVNICGDEPYDLGKGRNRDRPDEPRALARADSRGGPLAARPPVLPLHDTNGGPFATNGAGSAYIRYIRHVHDLCAARGRRTQFWSDVVRNHPDLVDRLPSDSTVLHWGYDDRADYDGVAAFVDAGLDTFVCPGTSGWKRIINAMGLAERNIATFANAGINFGATGLLNTDWGDHGHFNLPACSWHGIALGAGLAWRVDHATGDTFDRAFASVTLRIDDSEVVSKLRRASRLADQCETWRLLWTPLAQIVGDPTIPAQEDLAEAQHAAQAALGSFDRLVTSGSSDAADPRDLQELSLACRFSGLLAEKLMYVHDARTLRGSSHPLPDATENQSRDGRSETSRCTAVSGSGRSWADSLSKAAHAYADCWQARNKPSGLDDIRRALRATGAEFELSGRRE